MRTELVTTLKRKATEIIDHLQRERVPVLITQHGKPAAYLVDVESFEATERRLSVLEGIAIGEQAVREGRVTSHSDAKKRLARWLGYFGQHPPSLNLRRLAPPSRTTNPWLPKPSYAKFG